MSDHLTRAASVLGLIVYIILNFVALGVLGTDKPGRWVRAIIGWFVSINALGFALFVIWEATT